MGKMFVLVTLLVGICSTGAANAQEFVMTFGDPEPAIWVITAGVAAFGSGMCIYNWHRLHEGNPNVAAGCVGLLSSVMSVYWAASVFDVSSESRFQVAGVGMALLGVATAFYSVGNLRHTAGARADHNGLRVAIQPTVVCHGGPRVAPGVQVKLTF